VIKYLSRFKKTSHDTRRQATKQSCISLCKS